MLALGLILGLTDGERLRLGLGLRDALPEIIPSVTFTHI